MKSKIAFMAVLQFSPQFKTDFWPILTWQKMGFGQKNFFRKMELFDFTSFFWAWPFLNFLAHCHTTCFTNTLFFVYKNRSHSKRSAESYFGNFICPKQRRINCHQHYWICCGHGCQCQGGENFSALTSA